MMGIHMIATTPTWLKGITYPYVGHIYLYDTVGIHMLAPPTCMMGIHMMAPPTWMMGIHMMATHPPG